MTETSAVILEQHDTIATITLNRPRYRNAVNLATLTLLEQTLDAVQQSSVRAVILQAAAPGFCSGIDLKESAGASAEFALFRVTAMHRVLTKLRSLSAPLIVAIDGVCTGLGCELAISGDIRLATAAARFCYTEPRVGVPSPAHHLIHLVGLARAQEMLLTARWVESTEAAQIGLVTRLVENAEDEAQTVAAQVAELAPLAVAWTKENIRLCIAEASAAATLHHSAKIAAAAATTDRHEALAAFSEKRPPQFTGQ